MSTKIADVLTAFLRGDGGEEASGLCTKGDRDQCVLVSHGTPLAWHADTTRTRHTRIWPSDIPERSHAHYMAMLVYFEAFHIGVTLARTPGVAPLPCLDV